MNLDNYSVGDLLRKRKAMRRQLAATEGMLPVRIAVLGGSTTNEVVDLLDIYLLAAGFDPTFYQSEYGRFYEDTVLDQGALIAFAPDIVYVHTSYRNVISLPDISCSEIEFQAKVDAEAERYSEIWEAITGGVSAQVIQNNFELPPHALLGNIDSQWSGGASRFFLALNEAFSRAAAGNSKLLLNDIHRLSSSIGHHHWFDWDRYFSYKLLYTPEANNEIAQSLTSIIRAMYGRSRKVLVLDLDNTLWGGVIGDDGVDGIQIGRETAVAEAYTSFQEYCLSLHKRGVLLAVCSKNDEETAKQGFSHPDSVLKLEHFSSFKANWEPKHENILAIAKELNLGVDSFVFVDDNPAERAIVEAQIAGICVPDVGTEVSRYPTILERGRYFEPISLSQEDLSRSALYESNAARADMQTKFADYGEYLDSLEMTAEIERFKPVYLERIAQLTNKTNQFNLTTRRYTLSEMEEVLRDESTIGLYGRLSDRFGDNGLVSIVIGRREDSVLHLDLWLMSCRVLKRDMEFAMLDVLVEESRAIGIRTLKGYYLRTKKNGMVADHYEKLGFDCVSADPDGAASVWTLDISTQTRRNRHIRILEHIHG